MILADDFEDFIELLNHYKVDYMVVGGYALAFHGKPRFTGDLDIWINISDDNAKSLLKAISDFGMASLGFVKEDFLRPGYINQIGYPPLRIDILNEIDGIKFIDAKKNVQIITEGNIEINYIGIDDLLANKKATGRKRDLDDIKEIKKVIKNRRSL